MKQMRIGLAAVNQVPMDWIGNMQRIRQALEESRGLGIRVLCFPELCISGYGCEDRFLHPDTAQRSLALTQELASDIGDEVVMVGLPLCYNDLLYNGVAVLHQGKIQGITLKCHLAREGIHYEPRWFNRWIRGTEVTLETQDAWIPMGNLVYQFGDLAFAVEICEDAWVSNPQRPCLYYEGVPLVFNASASHFSMGKADIREAIVTNSSKDFSCVYAYTNLVGCESGRAIYDGELMIAQQGEVIARSDRLFLDDVKVMGFDLDVQTCQREPDVTMRTTAVPLPEKQLKPSFANRAHSDMSTSFGKAASLALLDYLRKSKARGFTLSLSGGVDSTTVGVLVWIMAQRLFNELPEEKRVEKLAYLGAEIAASKSAEALMRHILLCVYQKTRNSGSVTEQAAAHFAQAIGAQFMNLDVDQLVEGYKTMIGDALGTLLNWQEHDQALQNIQARVRGPGVWMLANIKNHLLLTTSNRSEVAVGYATMDGDTCGGLAPIAGVQKTFLREWLVLMEKQGIPGIEPLSVLKLINQQAPTAELRPPEQTQEDEKDLMPYEVLDFLERAMVSQRQTPLESFQQLQGEFPQFPLEKLHQWTRKFCWLFSISQWKRERYAPSFHLDDRSLDPKTWARYPILSAPMSAELKELDRFVQTQMEAES